MRKESSNLEVLDDGARIDVDGDDVIILGGHGELHDDGVSLSRGPVRASVMNLALYCTLTFLFFRFLF